MSNELTTKDRLSYASSKMFKALKWIVLSGTATFFLTGLLDIVSELQVSPVVTLVIYLVINTVLYGINEFRKGQDS